MDFINSVGKRQRPAPRKVLAFSLSSVVDKMSTGAGITAPYAFGLSLDNKDSDSRRGVPLYIKYDNPDGLRLRTFERVRVIGIYLSGY